MPAYREHAPPSWLGLCAGARGFTQQPDTDHLLLWWRSGGTVYESDVRLYLARRGSLAWTCKPEAGRMAIEHAISIVAVRRAPNAGEAAKELHMRKETFLGLRGDAVRWLRHGVDGATDAYNRAR